MVEDVMSAESRGIRELLNPAPEAVGTRLARWSGQTGTNHGEKTRCRLNLDQPVAGRRGAQADVPDVVRAKRFEVVDDQGKGHAALHHLLKSKPGEIVLGGSSSPGWSRT